MVKMDDGYTIKYYMCDACQKRKERLIEPTFMNVAETKTLLLWTLRNVYPRLYRIKDLRRLLCEYI